MNNTLKTPEVKYAGFWVRASAFVVDLIILGLMSAVLTRVAIALGGSKIILAATLLITSCEFLYRPLCHAAYGKTGGKLLLGIQVTTVELLPLSYPKAFLREVLSLPNLLFALAAAYLVITPEASIVDRTTYRKAFKFFYTQHAMLLILGLQISGAVLLLAQVILVVKHPQHRALHDLIARTAVRSTRAEKRQASVEEGYQECVCLICGGQLPRSESVCTNCGWTYASEEGEEI